MKLEICLTGKSNKKTTLQTYILCILFNKTDLKNCNLT